MKSTSAKPLSNISTIGSFARYLTGQIIIYICYALLKYTIGFATVSTTLN
jgi:hypothetical protein